MTSTALATPDNSPSGLVAKYSTEFAAVLPSHIKPEVWNRVAVSCLRRDPRLAAAAANDTGALMTALLDAARKGLEPGTEQYYLTVRKEKGVPKVKGIEGYQGIVERIYRAGAASSVIVEVVRENDKFTYVPGVHERPVHEVDWFGSDRGPLVGVYAYATMIGGATSKVVVLNKAKVMEAKAKSDGADSHYSRWNQGDGEGMWLKTDARRLEKWCPTSNEYLKHRLRAVAEVQAETPTTPPSTPFPSSPQPADPETGEILEGEFME